MKKISIISLALGVAAIFSSCESLDYSNPGALSDGTFWQTETHAKQGIVGLYNQFRTENCFGREFAFDAATDIAQGTVGERNLANALEFTVTNGIPSRVYQGAYELVHRSNTAMRNLAQMEVLDDATKNTYIAEARMMRAMAYFRLLSVFGGVPYYDETCVIDKEFMDLTDPRTDAATLRAKIIEDLDFAVANLPVSWAAGDYGRLTKGAAVAIRGKVYLYNQEWAKAAADFEDLIYNKTTNYGYALHPDYYSLFRLMKGARSAENILCIESIDGNVAGYALNIVDVFGNKSTMRLISSNNCVPSVDFVDSYEYLDGKKFNWDEVFPGYNAGDAAFRMDKLAVAINTDATLVTNTLNADTTKIMDVYRNRDPRCNITVWTPYTHYLGTDAGSNPVDKQFVIHDPTKGGSPAEALAFVRNDKGWTSYYWRKWIPTGNLDGYWGEYNRTPYTFAIVRLADVMLMLSECYNEMGNLTGAVTELNKVRERAGVALLNNGSSWMAVTSKDQMTQRIRDERKWELAGEGQRYFDLMRWGALKGTVKTATDILGNLMYQRTYDARMEIWPIPFSAIERNPNLTQNPAWM